MGQIFCRVPNKVKYPMAIAFFDFDGTLTWGDSFIPYCLLSLFHQPQRVLAMKPVLKGCLDICRGKIRRHELKEIFLGAFLGEAKREDVERLNRIFLRLVIPKITRERMLMRARRHQQAGDKVYIVSASPNIYLEPLATEWQMDGVICTMLEWQDGRLTGRILGKNCRGAEKARRVRALFDEEELRGSYGYGNSDGDRHLLELVSFSFYV